MDQTGDIPLPQRPKVSERRSFASLRSIFALMLREMATGYGRSPGGYIWAVLEPVAATMFLSYIFSLIMNAPLLGNSFPMFYSTGILPFTMFMDLQGKISQSLNYSKPLLAYPTVTFVDAIAARFLINLLTQLLVAYLIFGGAIYFFEGSMKIDVMWVVLGLLLAALLALGVGVLNCYIILVFPVWQQVWSVLMRPMFLISGALSTLDAMPLQMRQYMLWNPLVHIVGLVRRGFYESYAASYAQPFYVLGVSMVCLLLGLVLLRTNYRNLLEQN